MNRNKEQMLDYLVKAFIADSDDYKNMEIPNDESQKKIIFILKTWKNYCSNREKSVE